MTRTPLDQSNCSYKDGAQNFIFKTLIHTHGPVTTATYVITFPTQIKNIKVISSSFLFRVLFANLFRLSLKYKMYRIQKSVAKYTQNISLCSLSLVREQNYTEVVLYSLNIVRKSHFHYKNCIKILYF